MRVLLWQGIEERMEKGSQGEGPRDTERAYNRNGNKRNRLILTLWRNIWVTNIAETQNVSTATRRTVRVSSHIAVKKRKMNLTAWAADR